MPHPKTYTSSSIGPAPNLGLNFLDREEEVSITWDDGFDFTDTSWFRVHHLCEPMDVWGSSRVRDKLIENSEFYDLILAFDEKVLRECPNSVFITESACSWMDRKSGKISPAPLGFMRVDGYAELQQNPVVVNYTPCDVNAKKFEVSFLTSNKNIFPGHVLRQEIYDKLPEQVGQIKTWKHRSPPRVEDKRTILEPYQYSICPENSRHSGYYSEKLVDCFIAKTIPIYYGCTDIGRHFNSEGILEFDGYDSLRNILSSLTPEYFQNKLAAIEENYHTALKGVHQWDLIEWAITKGIQQKKELGLQHKEATVPTEQFRPNYPFRPIRTRLK